MSVQKEGMLKVTLLDTNGESVTVRCSKEIGNLLLSDSTDSKVKEMICRTLIQSSSVSSAPSEPPLSPVPASPEEPAFLPEPVSADTVSKWTPEAEKLLLEKFSLTEKSKSHNKWKGVSDSLRQMGYNFNGEQCRLKIKGLKEKYERNKKKSQKSGESPPDSDCEELKDVFDRCPDMNPVFVIDTSAKQTTTNSSKQTSLPRKSSDTNSMSCEEDEDSGSIQVLPSTSGRKKRPLTSSCKEEQDGADDLQKDKRRPRRSIDMMKSFMEDILMKKEEAAERRHREKLDCVNALIGVLKDSVKKDN